MQCIVEGLVQCIVQCSVQYSVVSCTVQWVVQCSVQYSVVCSSVQCTVQCSVYSQRSQSIGDWCHAGIGPACSYPQYDRDQDRPQMTILQFKQYCPTSFCLLEICDFSNVFGNHLKNLKQLEGSQLKFEWTTLKRRYLLFFKRSYLICSCF